MVDSGVFIFLFMAFVIALFVDAISDKLLLGSKLLLYSTNLLLLGFVCVVGSSYFGLHVVGLRYGLVPEVGDPDAGVFVGKYLIGIACLDYLTFVAAHFLKKSDRRKR